MVTTNINPDKSPVLPEQLLALLTEDLKRPLAQIARTCELAALSSVGYESSVLADVRQVSDAALRLIESYSLGLELANLESGILALEPVAAAGILADVVRELDPVADRYGVKLELELTSRHLPVIANARVLSAALMSAGYSLLDAISANERAGSQTRLKLCLRSSAGGAEAGWYWDEPAINHEIMKRGRELILCRQPLAQFTSAPTSGIFIADMLLGLMDSKLRATKSHHLSGLAARLKTSSQLALV